MSSQGKRRCGLAWFTIKPEVVKDTASALLQGLEATAPGLGKIGLNFLGQGFRPDEAGWRLGQVITEKISQLQQEAACLQWRIQQVQQKHAELAGDNQRLRNEPLRLRIKDLQQENYKLSSRAERTAIQVRQQDETAQRVQKLHALEVERLQAQVGELQRLVAKQHMQLINLLGDNFTRSEGETQNN